ncbi:hypothetical protein LXL04_038607 [Taraxacum kok-saghyz]
MPNKDSSMSSSIDDPKLPDWYPRNPLIISGHIHNVATQRVYVDTGSSTNILSQHYFRRLPERWQKKNTPTVYLHQPRWHTNEVKADKVRSCLIPGKPRHPARTTKPILVTSSNINHPRYIQILFIISYNNGHGVRPKSISSPHGKGPAETS